MSKPLPATYSVISGNSILKYCGLLTSFLTLLVLVSSFTNPAIKKQTPATNTLDKLGLSSATPAAGAYSLRLLSSDYNGPLVRITIGSNFYDVYPDATTNHGFSLTSTVSASYSTYNAAPTGATGTTLSAIIGSNSATVAIWYDQSGNGLNGVQGTPSQQPQIINAGTINITNSKPALKFTGGQWLVVTTTAFNNDLSGSVVYSATSANITSGNNNSWFTMNGILGSEQSNAVADFGYGIYNSRFTAGNGPSDASTASGTVVNDGVIRISTWTRQNSNGAISLYTNTVTDGGSSLNQGARTAVPSVAIGSITVTGTGNFNGSISEIALFPVVYSVAERQAVENSQGTYYGTVAVLPTVSYGAAQIFAQNVAITPVTPTATNVAAAGYKTAVVLATLSVGATSMTSDSHGNIYFLDADNLNVKKVDASGNVSVSSSGYGVAANMAIDANDNLYVLDLNFGKVVKTYVSDGHTEDISLGINGLIAANKAGDIYYTNYDGTAVRLGKRYASDGHIEDLPVTFGNPVSMVVDYNDNIYVLDNNNGSITKVKPDNTTSVVVSVPGTSIISVAVDGEGNIYWTDQRSAIHKKNVGNNTYEDTTLPNNATYGLVARPDGKVFYGNYTNKQIYGITPSGGYYIDKPLPAGLVFDRATGTISGTPTTATAAKDYTVTSYNNTASTASIVNIAVKSGNANLSTLAVSGATINPVFDAGTITYTSSVGLTASVDITPTAADAGATIAYNGNPVTSGSIVTVPLAGGDNAIAFIVTAPSGATKTYTITINKAVLPTVSYGAAQIFAQNVAITPVTPTATNVAAAGYKTAAVLATLSAGATSMISDSHGNIYFLDTDNLNVKKLDAAGNVSVSSSGYGVAANMAIDANDNLYVLDLNFGKVVKTYASDGHKEDISLGINGLIAANKAGDIYYTNYDGTAVHLGKRYASDGHIEDLPVTFGNPVSMVVDYNDNIYVLDNNNGAITKIKPDNTTSVEVSVPGTSIVAVAVDGEGNIYWTDQRSAIHKKYISNNTYEDITLPSNAFGLVARPDGKLFYSNYINKQIYGITPSGGYYIDKPLPAGLIFDRATGTISGTPTTVTAAKDYTVTSYNNTVSTASIVNITVKSVNADLSALAVSGATISPVFDADIIAYTASVASTIASVNITPTAVNASATITYNSNPVTSGSPVTIPLTVGDNAIAFIVTGPDGATKTYTITINKSSPSTLSYGADQAFAINTAITPVTPTATNVGTLGYNNPVTDFGSNLGGQAAKAVFDKAGNAYLISNFRGNVEVVPANGSPAYTIGGPFSFPLALAIDKDDNLYVSDDGGLTSPIYKIAAGTNTSTLITSNYAYVSGIAPDNQGNLYIGDTNGGKVSKYNIDTNTGIDVSLQPTHPATVILRGDKLYVSDVSTTQIVRMDLDGSNLTEVVNYSGATSFDIDATGFIYSGNSGITRWNLDGSNAQNIPTGISDVYTTSTDTKGKVYIGKISGDVMKVLQPSGGYFIDKLLPEGLSIDPNTGTISGTPTELLQPTQYKITAYNGIESVTSNITISVASNNADLSTLAVTGATLSPVFDAGTIAYTASVVSTVASVDITPTVADAGATITYNGNPVTSGSPVTVTLAGGDNTIAFVVKPAAGATKTYTITITKVTPPTVSYGAAQIFAINTAITPVAPTAANVAAMGYGSPVNFGSVVYNTRNFLKDSQGNYYLLDGVYKLYKYPAGGGAAVQVQTRTSDMGYPSLMAIDNADNLYVSDADDHYIRKIDTGTGIITDITNSITYPFDLAIAKDGTIYVADTYNNAIQKIPAGSSTPVEIGTGFNAPTGVALDAAGNLYVADQGNGKLKKIWLTTNGHTEDITDIRQPVAVTVDKADNVFVSDLSNSRIYELPANGSGPQIIASGYNDFGEIYALQVDDKGVINIARQTPYTAGKIMAPTGGYFINTKLPAGLSFDQNTGTISGTPTELLPPTQYKITAYNGIESVTSNITISVASNNANLSTLAVSGATISPVFDAGTIAYTASVASTTASVDITPTVADAGATITYNGNPVTSGSVVTIPIANGDNIIAFVVKPAAGATKTYTITINKAAPPTVSYGTAQTFAINTAITPVTPSATNVAAFGYSSNFGTVGGNVTQALKIKKDAQGNVYLLDNAYPSQLFKFPANGSAAIEIPTGGFGSKGFAFDDAGNIYVVDVFDNVLKKIEAGTGTITTIATGFSGAYSVAVGKNGIIYVADFNDNSIKQVPAGGGTPVVVGTGFNAPTDVAVDAAGNVYVADQGNGKLKKIWITTDGHTEDVTDIRQPVAVAVDKADNVFVSDLSNFRIYELPANGSGPQIIASGSAMQNIYGLDADAKGVVYAAQLINNTGTVITPSGGYFINTKLPAGLNFDQTTGIISGTPTELLPPTQYKITAYNSVESVTSNITISVASNNTDLSTLAVTGATLSPAFDAGTIAYTASVLSSVASVDITPTVADAGATITYNGNPVTSGSVVTIPITSGDNAIAFVVTAGAGATKTYTITITKSIPPTLSYVTPQSFFINTAVTPVAPTAGNVAAMGYGSPVNFGSVVYSTRNFLKDSQGNYYLLDGNYKLYKYPAGGGAAVEVQTRTSGTGYPSLIALDGADNLYVSDADDQYIRKIDAGTGIITDITNSISYPFDLAIAKDGTIYVADTYTNAIRKIPAGSSTPVEIGTGFNQPTGVALDASGDLYVADQGNGKLKKIWLTTNGHTEDVTDIRQPVAVTVDKADNVFVSDLSNMRIYELPANGSGPQIIASGYNDFSDIYGLQVDDKGVINIARLTPYTAGKIMTPTGGYFINTKLPAGLSFDQTTGIISGTPTKLSPATQYNITAYNGLENISTSLTLGVEANLNLTNLVTDAGALTPGFDANTTSYTVSVDNGTTSANITATVSEPSNSLTINGTAATSGTFASVALNAGDNNIPVVVTSPLDNSIKTYTVKIHRISNDYKLSNLTVSAGSLSPAFNADGLAYTVDLPYGTSSAKLTPTANAYATIKVNEEVTASGTASQSLSLNTGDNNIDVHVIAEDGTSATIYTVNLRVSAPSSVSLSNITLSAGTLSPAFDAGNTNYQVKVPVGTSSITIQPVVADALSVATVNGSTLDGTTGSVDVPLHDGLNTIAVSVLANDGTTKSYTITVNKLIPVPTSAPIATQVYNAGAAITPLGTGFDHVDAPGYFALADIVDSTIPTPTGIAINNAGDLFVADVTSSSVYKLPVGGGVPVAILTGLNTPLGVATDATGNVYAAALGSGIITKVTPGGTISNLGNSINFPTGLTVDATGNIYVNETATHSVKMITPAGVTSTVTTDLRFPYGITVDVSGNIYVADNGAGSIIKLGANGGARTVLISGLTNPTDVKVDAGGNIYVTDGGTNVLTKFDKDGANPVVISSGYTGLFGLAIGKAGYLYTTDNSGQSIAKLTPSGGYYLNEPLPDGLVFDTTTGIISGTPTTATAAKDYTITAYNSGGSTSSVVNISVVINTNLANLTTSSGTLDPVFDGTVTSYAVTVLNTVNSIKITPTVSDASATVTVNGTATVSGTESVPITLNTGDVIIPVIVTGRDNITTKQYNITVTRRPPLVKLAFVLNPLSVLTNTTGTADINYLTAVSPEVSSISVKPTTAETGTVIKINGQVVASGTFSDPIALNVGSTIINVLVTKDDVPVTTYSITVNRTGSNDARASFVFNPASVFTPTATGPAINNYTTSISSDVSSINVRATAEQANAIIKINGNTVQSGIFSDPIALNVGSTIINVSVMAQDGVTINTYSITVNRTRSNNARASFVFNPASVFTAAATGPAINNYTTSVSSDISSINVRATAEQANAVIKINGNTVQSGIFSDPIALNIGSTIINVSVTAQDGVTVNTYSITVNRASSNNARASFVFNPVSVFTATATGPALYNYTTSVASDVSSINVRATAEQANAVIKINGNTVQSGVFSDPIALNVGSTVINVSVTAQDGVTVNTYSITVNRANSNNARASFVFNPVSVFTSAITGPAINNYTTSVASNVSSINVRATAENANAVIRINGNIVQSGIFSDPIALNIGSTVINVSVTAQDGVTVNTYSITVNRAGSNNARASFVFNPSSVFTPTATGPAINNYTTSVASDVSSINVRATAEQANAVIKINGNTVQSGIFSDPIALNVGSTIINVSVTAQDGVTVNTYSITVNRAGSNNARASFVFNPASVFTSTATGPALYNYTTSVASDVSSINVRATAEQANAVIKINGNTVQSGIFSDPIALNIGSTVINVSVTAQDGVTVNTYSITVNRAGSNNARASFVFNPASVFTPTATGPAINNYTTSVASDVSSVSVRATAENANAVIRINGNIIQSGIFSDPIALNVGSTVINVSVIAQDGVTVNTYSITVNRAGSNNARASFVFNPVSVFTPTATGPAINNYTTSVSSGVSSINVRATAENANAVIKINGNIVQSGIFSDPIALNVGSTVINVSVMAQDGVTVNTYSITVNRTGSSNVSLNVALNPVTAFTLTTGPANVNYAATVAEGQNSILVIPTVYDNATVTVNGTAVTSGAASNPIALTAGGSTLIMVVVTAEDRSITKSYSINVNRPLSLRTLENNDNNQVLENKADNGSGDDKIVVHQGVSPNGDGSNDFLYIEGIGAYPGNKLSIINTNGSLLFEVKDYGKDGNNLFDGHSSTGALLKPGTYYYLLEYQVNKQNKRKTGYIILKY